MKLFKNLKFCVNNVFMQGFLTDENRVALRTQHRQEKNRRTADRIKAVLLSDKGWTYRQISEALLIDEQTISRHVDEYKDNQKLTVSSGGSMSKLDAVQTEALIAHLEHVTYMKVREICVHVRKTYGISYTIQGLTSWMHAQGFSFKKPAATPAKADLERQKAFMDDYENLMTSTPENEPILFGDGVHPTMATKVTYGWIRTGTRKPIATTASRTRMNIMGALDLTQMALHTTSHETLDSQAMNDHFSHLRKAYPDAPKIHLILDRGPYNISQKTRKAALFHNIQLHYLPPYSPNLNPIERCWKIMNEYVRNNRFFTSAKEFREAIMNFFDVTWNVIAKDMTDRVNDNFQRISTTLSI